MKVKEIMTQDVKACGPETNLAAVTEILWRNNCGALPVLDSAGKLVGILTDRDICIALGTRNRRASELAAGDVAVRTVFTCKPGDEIHEALKMMREHQVRRVPVVSDGALAGILCLDDIMLHAEKADGKKTAGVSYEDAVTTMKAICQRRAAQAA